MAKRKRLSTLATEQPLTTNPIPVPELETVPPPSPKRRRTSQRNAPQPNNVLITTNPNENGNIIDGPQALRASPDSDGSAGIVKLAKAGMVGEKQVQRGSEDVPSLINGGDSESPLSDLSDMDSPLKKRLITLEAGQSAKVNVEDAASPLKQIGRNMKKEERKEPQFLDPEADGEEEADEEEIQAALSRPPPVNSDYLPLPWKGRLGYDPSQPPHATKNRPDRDEPADVARGQAYVESIGLANAMDVAKMLRWNDRYGIKFMRLSSEMFPFASHEVYGYKLAPFASEVLAEAGKVAAELGHRLTTHPGQFTQLGSPRKEVIKNALRDLDYHAELLSLLKMPPQQNRDAVMILHMGGVFGDKAATLDRFRENYKNLPQGVKGRLVLENDDVSWSVHDLLPVCEELNIPLVLDYHHHNIIFDADKIREGTKDIVALYDRIKATWTRKGITQKMHYSEPTPAAITGRQRRKHSPRVATLPPCSPDMDLMIEAKDKEQAVFELMRVFKLPGYGTFNDMIPHVRKDDNKPVRIPKKKTPKKKSKKVKHDDDELEAAEEAIVDVSKDKTPQVILEEEVGMGGPEGRVYWPPGMEEWLRPVKRVVIKKDPGNSAKKENVTPAKKRKAAAEAAETTVKVEDDVAGEGDVIDTSVTPAKKRKPTSNKIPGVKKTKHAKKDPDTVPTPSTSNEELSEALPDLSRDESSAQKPTKAAPARKSSRAKKMSYVEEDDS
ncbi:MAG: hypothetical protein M1830_008209 [Pleopsidium flavum]|nr:MAG: hypothetical protein M1830_008209 [Pleopsidium flavum]